MNRHCQRSATQKDGRRCCPLTCATAVPARRGSSGGKVRRPPQDVGAFVSPAPGSCSGGSAQTRGRSVTALASLQAMHQRPVMCPPPRWVTRIDACRRDTGLHPAAAAGHGAQRGPHVEHRDAARGRRRAGAAGAPSAEPDGAAPPRWACWGRFAPRAHVPPRRLRSLPWLTAKARCADGLSAACRRSWSSASVATSDCGSARSPRRTGAPGDAP